MACKVVYMSTDNGRAKAGDLINVYYNGKGLGTAPDIVTLFKEAIILDANCDNAKIQDLLQPWFIVNERFISDNGEPPYIDHPEYNSKYYLDLPVNSDKILTLSKFMSYVKERE